MDYSNLSIQNIEILLRNETDPDKLRLFKQVIKDTIKKLENIKA
jgi:hypothetical protein